MAILMGVLNMKCKAVCKILGSLTLLFSFYDMKFACGRFGVIFKNAFIIRD